MAFTNTKLSESVVSINSVYGALSFCAANTPFPTISAVKTPVPLIGEVSTKTKANRERD